jgi:hypothetical protein
MQHSITAKIGAMIATAASLVMIGWAGEPQPSSSGSMLALPSDPIGPIRLLDLDGTPRDILPAGETNITVAIFIRSDCPISNRYAPDIRQLYADFHPRGVDFNLVYVDPSEDAEAIRAHLKEYEYPCPGLRDPTHALVAATGAHVTPEAVVFDANRKITYRGRIDDRHIDLGTSRSAATQHDLADAIAATHAGKPVAHPVTRAVGCYIADLE